MRELFHAFAKKISEIAGSPASFTLAILFIAGWAISGPLYNFSNTWQLVINTCTTILTFLMVFLIQNSQNRDSKAVQLKLDELIKAGPRASDKMIDLENMSEEEIQKFEEKFRTLGDKANSRSK